MKSNSQGWALLRARRIEKLDLTVSSEKPINRCLLELLSALFLLLSLRGCMGYI